MTLQMWLISSVWPVNSILQTASSLTTPTGAGKEVKKETRQRERKSIKEGI